MAEWSERDRNRYFVAEEVHGYSAEERKKREGRRERKREITRGLKHACMCMSVCTCVINSYKCKPTRT